MLELHMHAVNARIYLYFFLKKKKNNPILNSKGNSFINTHENVNRLASVTHVETIAMLSICKHCICLCIYCLLQHKNDDSLIFFPTLFKAIFSLNELDILNKCLKQRWIVIASFFSTFFIIHSLASFECKFFVIFCFKYHRMMMAKCKFLNQKVLFHSLTRWTIINYSVSRSTSQCDFEVTCLWAAQIWSHNMNGKT